MAGAGLRRRLLALADQDDAVRELELILDEDAWPAAAAVGEDGCAAALAIAIAATTRPAFQRRCLVMLKAAARRGDVPETHADQLERALSRPA
jgi:hypothetical protein